MNQTCKVCGEPAAGFHFGAFTCEGCKSFFGRSYNNLSSISECKNNGECVINKKNRTACKACRLRKCLLVGMSKSGSRYGRRSNWFKIHCLLQEQQQQAAAAAAAAAAAVHNSHSQKTPPPAPPTSLSMLGHPGAYPPGLYPPTRTKEELMMLGLEDYKHPAASPSVSSPDSHNSDSSIDVNVRNNTLLRLGGKHMDVSSSINKDLFLPLSFPGLSSLPVMPPPAFLPPSHLLFPGYHPALYQHHQGLLKPITTMADPNHPHAHLLHSPNLVNNNSRYTPNHNDMNNINNNNNISNSNSTNHIHSNIINHNNNHIPNGSKAAEELTKRFYLDAVLNSQRKSPHATLMTTTTSSTTTSNSITTPITNSIITPSTDCTAGSKSDEEPDVEGSDDAENEEDVVISMTPPTSPDISSMTLGRSGKHSTNGNDTRKYNGTGGDENEITRDNSVTEPAVAKNQDNPIDLSMKASCGSSSKSSVSSIDDNRCLSVGGIDGGDSDPQSDFDDHDEDENTKTTTTTTTSTTITTTVQKRNPFSMASNHITGDEDAEYDRDMKRMKLQITTTPLDLTTKV